MKILYNDKENEKFFVEMSYSDYGDITGTRYSKILYGVSPGHEIKLDALQRQDSINSLKAIYEHMARIKSHFDGLPKEFVSEHDERFKDETCNFLDYKDLDNEVER